MHLAERMADLARETGADGLLRQFIGCLGGLASLVTLHDAAHRAVERHRHARRERDGKQDE